MRGAAGPRRLMVQQPIRTAAPSSVPGGARPFLPGRWSRRNLCPLTWSSFCKCRALGAGRVLPPPHRHLERASGAPQEPGWVLSLPHSPERAESRAEGAPGAARPGAARSTTPTRLGGPQEKVKVPQTCGLQNKEGRGSRGLSAARGGGRPLARRGPGPALPPADDRRGASPAGHTRLALAGAYLTRGPLPRRPPGEQRPEEAGRRPRTRHPRGARGFSRGASPRLQSYPGASPTSHASPLPHPECGNKVLPSPAWGVGGERRRGAPSPGGTARILRPATRLGGGSAAGGGRGGVRGPQEEAG